MPQSLLETLKLETLSSLLAPFATVTETQLDQISTYIDILTRWNARTNLTAVREPEEIVTRHFGESLFAARHLLAPDSQLTALDVGSGAGFPGLPLKLWAPALRLTLIESQNKKATFLREVIRALTLTDVNVFSARAEDFSSPADLVTLRAVERFDQAAPVAARLVAPARRLALLIGAAQVPRALELLPHLSWAEPLAVPQSHGRVLLVGTNPESHEPTQ
jgi:16S rRNA (guanine527-N7)-methyltransferase